MSVALALPTREVLTNRVFEDISKAGSTTR